MNLRYLILASLLSAALTASTAYSASPGTRWNILYIVSDDLNDSLGCYGNPVVRSSNIDRLAARGMRFDRAYCNYPVCNPSRTSFLSDRRPDTTGVVDNATPTRTHLKDTLFLPELFRKHCYRTIKVGKIGHTGDEFSTQTRPEESQAIAARAPPARLPRHRLAPAGSDTHGA